MRPIEGESRHDDPLKDFVDEAMLISAQRSKPLSEKRKEFERLLSAVSELTRQRVMREVQDDQAIIHNKPQQ